MPLHQTIQRLILIGVRWETLPPAPAPQPPERLAPLIAALAPAHHAFDSRAVQYGHRYRSGFWSIYLLSAVAVLCAILPLALGWDDRGHSLHPYAGLWALAEVGVIATVSLIYWRGHRSDWRGEWLRTRTTAELTWYLPMLAPLVDFSQSHAELNWYTRVFDPGEHLEKAEAVASICASQETLASASLENAWSDPEFVTSYARWTAAVLEDQRRYHHRTARRQHALSHRVHAVNSWLFALTALGALAHLLVHTLWLSLITTFFPALGASLHGALAQSEAYRLSVTSERLELELGMAVTRISSALDDASRATAVKGAIEDALALILEEHQDWQMLVRPHHLPLA